MPDQKVSRGQQGWSQNPTRFKRGRKSSSNIVDLLVPEQKTLYLRKSMSVIILRKNVSQNTAKSY